MAIFDVLKTAAKVAQEAGKILGIEIADHVIVSGKTFMSFQQKKLL